MNEHTTSGLINLFALFSVYIHNPEGSREKVESYLLLTTGRKPTEEYLGLYDNLTDFYKQTIANQPIWIENASKVIDKLGLNLTRTEMVLVYLRLVELLSVSGREGWRPLMEIIGELFNIEIDLQRELFYFIDPSVAQVSPSRFLKISSTEDDLYKHFIIRNVKGYLLVYHHRELNLMVIRLIGEDLIYIESSILKSSTFQVLDPGDALSGPGLVSVNYTEIYRNFYQQEQAGNIVFQADSIGFRFPDGTYGLHAHSFSERSGSFVAVMGSSGSGKTTLMNLLNGTIVPDMGSLSINGFDLHDNKHLLEGLIGYVPQDDMLHEDLTVYQNLFYAAKLSFRSISPAKLWEKVIRVLEQLELASISHLKAGSYLNKTISSGQRKRLNIALELIREPAILLLDEPTSGLSSTDAEKVALLLREQSNSGKLVIMNIHQPSSKIFRMFDTLWILDQGGYVIYQGPPLDAITHFKRHAYQNRPEERECSECGTLNPEEIFLIIEDKVIDSTGHYSTKRKVSPAEWYQIFHKENQAAIQEPAKNKESLLTKKEKPTIFEQFKVFFQRNWKLKTANGQFLLTSLTISPLMALVVALFSRYAPHEGYTLFHNKHLPVYLFMSVVVSLFVGMMTSAGEIIRDRALLKREQFLHLNWGSYLNSKVLFLLILSAYQALAYVWVGNVLLQVRSQFFLYWTVLFMTSAVANLIGLNLSNWMKSQASIYILVPVLLIPQLLLGGLIVKYEDFYTGSGRDHQVPSIANLITSRWAYEALAVGQFRENEYQEELFPLERDYYNSHYYSNIALYELESRLDQNTKSGEQNLSKHNRILIENEIASIGKLYPFLKSDPSTLNKELMSSELSFLKSQFRIRKIEAQAQIDSLLLAKKTLMGEGQYEKIRMNHSNQALSDLVKNTGTTNFFRETQAKLVRLYAPVYAESSTCFPDAPFYASEKGFMGFVLKTPWFNILMMAFQGTFLYILLYLFPRGRFFFFKKRR